MRYESFHVLGACVLALALAACEGPALPATAAAGSGGSSAVIVTMMAGAAALAPPSTTSSAPPPLMAAGASGAGSCARGYTTALRARADMSWPDTIGLVGGQGTLTFWTKLKHTPAANGGETLEQVPCGVSLPIVTTSPLLDGVRLLNEIPTSSFDLPSMPHYPSSSSWRGGMLIYDTGAILLGIALDDPSAAWPQRAALHPADHDGDGEPGVTAIPKNGDGFGLPPADIGQTEQVDRVYIAARLRLRFSAGQASCAGTVQGSAEPLAFDYSIVGCHVQNGGDCQSDQTNLLYNNSPGFTLGARGESTSIPIADDLTCEQLIAALPLESAN